MNDKTSKQKLTLDRTDFDRARIFDPSYLREPYVAYHLDRIPARREFMALIADEIERLRVVFDEACNEVKMSHGKPCFCKYCHESQQGETPMTQPVNCLRVNCTARAVDGVYCAKHRETTDLEQADRDWRDGEAHGRD